MSERPNVLLVVLDSVRARNTSLHGYERDTTPFLRSLADRSTVYTQARAPGIHSIASHVSMFTGLHVEEHEAFHHTAQIDPARSIWPTLAAEHGYATGLFTNNRIVSNASNLGTHFEHRFEPDYPLANRLENTLGHPLVERTYFRLSDLQSRLRDTLPAPPRAAGSLAGAATRVFGRGDDAAGYRDTSGGFKTRHGGTYTDGFLTWASGEDGPWAACINLMDAHLPYHPEPAHDEWADEEHWAIQRDNTPSVRESLTGDGWDRLAALEALYDGTIHQADAIVRDLVAELESRGLLSETLLVITSDHGEGFGEPSRIDPTVRLREHKWGIHELLTHVPLLVRFPGQTDRRVVDQVVSLTDLPALIRATADGSSSSDTLVTDGPVLASTVRLPESKTVKYRSVDGVDRFVGPWRAVYEDHGGSVRKFARHGSDAVTLDIDAPDAAQVVSRSDDGRVADAYERLEQRDALTQRQTEIDEDLEAQLEQLGYIR